MMKRISVKLALFLMTIILAASLLSFLASTLISRNVLTEIREDQLELAFRIQEIREKTGLPLEVVMELFPHSMFHVKPTDEIPLGFVRREGGPDSVFLTGKKLGTTAVAIVDDTYLRIELQPQKTLLGIIASRLWDSLLFFVVIGGILTGLLVSQVARPIVELTEATKEIAKGNFDIELKTQSNDEIGQLTRNFNQMAQELRNIEYLRKDFIGNVSHEFKTPIASIQGFAQLLQNPDLSREEREEYLAIIVEETARLSSLSSNMMKLSKLEYQEILVNETVFSLDEQVRRCVVLLATKWEAKELSLELELEPCTYEGNEEMLQQVWLNLLGNAVKFSPEGSKIRITLQQQPKEVVCSIRDEGLGMTEKVMGRIFEKFYQGDEAHSGEGSGLGLPLAKKIVELHGGTIHVTSTPSLGSTFTVALGISCSRSTVGKKNRVSG